MKGRVEHLCFVCLSLVVVTAATAHRAKDSLLFTVALDGDTGSLRYCSPNHELRETLSGPVLMTDHSFLFYSRRGYVLYDRSGTVTDSHDVFSDKNKTGYTVAYPLDNRSLLCYTSAPENPDSLILYRKRLHRKRIRKLKSEESSSISRVESAYPCNIAHSVVTDEMSVKVHLRPGLVGFTQMTDGLEWWSLEKFFGFTSPILCLNDGRVRSLCTGAKGTGRIGRKLNRGLVEPLAVWGTPDDERYVGVHATVGSESETYFQFLYECDRAGNILHVDTLPKQMNEDVVLGENADENMYYTARQTSQFVYQPVVDDSGCIYYGLLDYNKKEIRVYARLPVRYQSSPADDKPESMFTEEKTVTWKPTEVGCGVGRSSGARIPNVTFANAGGRRVEARDLERDGYIVRIFRPTYRDLVKKLSRARNLYPHFEPVFERILEDPTVECPYSLSLSGPGGVKTTFDYGIGERVLCARVLAAVKNVRAPVFSGDGDKDLAVGIAAPEDAVLDEADEADRGGRSDGENRVIVVRIDLENRAEIVLFESTGDFVNRFIFSREPYETRRDLVVAGIGDEILELDYESDSDGKVVAWNPRIR